MTNSRLAARFGHSNFSMLQSREPLTDDQLIRVAPSIFAAGKHDSRSDRYTYIPTIDILNGLRREGFLPFMVVQSRAKDEDRREHTKHMLRLRHADQIAGAASHQQANEIVLINSHDGTSSYQMLAGVYRFVCQNGMICGDTVEDIRVPHRGNIVHDVIEAAYSIVDEFEVVDRSREIMQETRLALPEASLFAQSALALKYDEEDYAPIRSDQLLTVRRSEDRKDDLWTTFNRVQENMIRGGIHGHTRNGGRTSTREVRSIDTNVKLNRALWMLAEGMRNLKEGKAV